MPSLPPPRGDMSAELIAALARPPHELGAMPVPAVSDPVADEDLQLALYLCYELHYRGLPRVSEEWEWDPSLLRWRARLEGAFEAALREAVPVPARLGPGETALALRALSELDGPSLSQYLLARATAEQMREFMIHRSAYQLKEADPHSWAIPRLSGPAKAALVEVQADEYGGGRPDWVHAVLFARAMRAVGLDDEYGAYLAVIPGLTL